METEASEKDLFSAELIWKKACADSPNETPAADQARKQASHCKGDPFIGEQEHYMNHYRKESKDHKEPTQAEDP